MKCNRCSGQTYGYKGIDLKGTDSGGVLSRAPSRTHSSAGSNWEKAPTLCMIVLRRGEFQDHARNHPKGVADDKVNVKT